MFVCKLFTPRGFSGLDKLISDELVSRVGLLYKPSEPLLLKSNLVSRLSSLRVAQSAWISLVEDALCVTVDQLEKIVQSIEFVKLPRLNSVGPRVVVAESGTVSKKEIENVFTSILPQRLLNNEFSIHLGRNGKLSIGMNAIPPRPWVIKPIDRAGVAWWSTGVHADVTNTDVHQAKASAVTIREYRNESSRACLSAALVRASSLNKQILIEDTLVWDPFIGVGNVLLETIWYMHHLDVHKHRQDASCNIRNLQIVGNGKSIDEVTRRIEQLADSLGLEISVQKRNSGDDEVYVGRRRIKKNTVEATRAPTDTEIIIKLTSTNISINLTKEPFPVVFPYIAGALILTHIPKTYSELVGIDKHTLSDWTTFGNLLRSSHNMQMYTFSETNSFAKYSKLKFQKIIHLVAPNGTIPASINKWIV